MKFCVIGIGRFGRQLAITLAENGMEVLAVDSSESIISSIRDQVTQAVCMRVTDEASLRSIGVEEMDVVIVAMGENFAQSVLITALLKKKLNAPKVIARAINELHKDILLLIGADQVVLPEQEIGNRLADALSSPVSDLVSLSKNFSISQLKAPSKFVGRSPKELKLFETYHVHCIGIRTEDNEIIPVDHDYIIVEDDQLILAGDDESLEKVAQL